MKTRRTASKPPAAAPGAKRARKPETDQREGARQPDQAGAVPSAAAAAAAAAAGAGPAAAAAQPTAAELEQQIAELERQATAAAAAAEARAAAILARAGGQAESARQEGRGKQAQLLTDAHQKRALLIIRRQASSPFVQVLLPSSVLPLVVARLGKVRDRVHLALACKALYADYRRQPAVWLEGLELNFAPTSAAALASQRSQLLQLLQSASGSRQQPAAGRRHTRRTRQQAAAGGPPLPFDIGLLYLVQEPAVQAGQLLEVATLLAPRLQSLDVHLWTPSIWFGQPRAQLAGPFPKLLSLHARLGGTAGWAPDRSCLLDIDAPRLQRLQLRSGTLRQLPPALTSLDLFDVQLEEPAASAMLAATNLRALHLARVATPEALPWGHLSRLAGLTSLKLCWMPAAAGHVKQALAGMPSLRRLELNSGKQDTLAHVSDQLTELVLKMDSFQFSAPPISDVQRLTSLRSLVLSADLEVALQLAPYLAGLDKVLLL